MKKQKKNREGVGHFGVKLVAKKELNEYSSKILFPEKLKEMNKIIKNLKTPLPK